MKKIISIAFVALFTLSLTTTYATNYKTSFGIEVPEGDDKKKKKKGESTTATETKKSCAPTPGKACCAHGEKSEKK